MKYLHSHTILPELIYILPSYLFIFLTKIENWVIDKFHSILMKNENSSTRIKLSLEANINKLKEINNYRTLNKWRFEKGLSIEYHF